MKDYRIPVEFTAVIAAGFHHPDDPIIVSVSDPDVEEWFKNLTWEEMTDTSRVFQPGIYDAQCETYLDRDQVYIRFKEVTKRQCSSPSPTIT